MTITILNIPSSGVTLDDQSARVDMFHPSDVQIVPGAAIGVTDKWLEFRQDVVGNRPCAGIGQDVNSISLGAAVLVISGYLNASGSPTNTFGMPIMGETGANNYMYARIGYGGGNTRVAVTDWQKNLIAESVTQVPKKGWVGFAICYDWLNYPTVHVRIYMNGGGGWVQEAHVDSGLSRINFFNSSQPVIWGELVGIGRGAFWRGCHLCLSYSTTTTDAPHLTPWPVFMSGGCVPPKAQGFYDEWSGGASTHPIGSGLRWQDLGATHDMQSPTLHPGNDGDTSLVASANINEQKQTFINAADAHPISTVTSPTIDNVRLAVVTRVSGGGKVGGNPMLRLGGSDSFLNSWTAGTSYAGIESLDMTRPGGGSWAVADFAPGAGLEWGSRTFTAAEASGASVGGRMTSLPGPIPTYHTETLPTGEPGAAGLETPRQVAGAKAPVIRPQFDHLAEMRASGAVLRQMRETEETLRRIIRARRYERCGRSGSVRVLR